MYDEAAVKMQAAARGRASRRDNFNLAEAQHALQRTPMAVTQIKPLSLKQLGIARMPKNPVPSLRFLTFNSWWEDRLRCEDWYVRYIYMQHGAGAVL
jgi:hypothetical protein